VCIGVGAGARHGVKTGVHPPSSDSFARGGSPCRWLFLAYAPSMPRYCAAAEALNNRRFGTVLMRKGASLEQSRQHSTNQCILEGAIESP
jgi:hypothetical protein